MIIWILLFLFVLVVSFVLALRSMRNYRERPSNLKAPFSLYLIQNQTRLNPGVVEELAKEALGKKLVLSFERLFKGGRRALVVYGPTEVLSPKAKALGLLELEEYSNKSYPHSVAFEVGEKVNGKFDPSQFRLPAEELGLEDAEQLWWQVVAQPQSESRGLVLNSVIRVVINTQTAERLHHLQSRLALLIHDSQLTRIPQSHSSSKILEFYKNRAVYNLFSSNKEYLKLSSEDLFSLISPLR